MVSKKRKSAATSSRGGSSLFAALSKLEGDDVRAAKTRHRATASTTARSLAARAQTGLAGDLVQCRILMQKAVGWSTAASERDADDSVVQSSEKLLVKLLEARRKLCLQHGTKKELSKDNNFADYSELILNNEGGDDSEGSDGEGRGGIHAALCAEYEQCRSEWREIFNRRHSDLRLQAGLAANSSSKFRVMNQSFWEQVESTAAHERLMRVSQDASGNGRSREDDADERAVHDMAPSFDDTKIYQHMLRDFVALGNATEGGGSNLAADAAAQRLRRAAQKKKGQSGKDVDRKASKGRKIRYTVNTKLENFTFPLSRPVPTIGEDDWFRSLFGGAGRKQATLK